MKNKVDKALERLHAFLSAIEDFYDLDLMRMATEALTPIYIILKVNQGIEQPESKKDNRHLRLVQGE